MEKKKLHETEEEKEYKKNECVRRKTKQDNKNKNLF
jgi:hypothetical protein